MSFAAACLIAILAGCNSTGKGGTTPPSKEYLKAMVNADYTKIGNLGGTAVTNGKATFEGNSVVKTVNLGELAELGQVNQGESRLFKITITGDNVHQAIFYEVPIAGTTQLKTDVINNTTVDIDKLINWILLGNINCRYDSKGTLALSFNPDLRGTGARLTTDYIIPTESTVNKIASLSNGIITGVQSDRNGNYTTIPDMANGEARTFYDSQSNVGVRNDSYPTNSDRVKSLALSYNPKNAGPDEVPGEVIDGFYLGNQNISPTNPNISGIIWQMIELSFKRPAGNDESYKIFIDHEERKGFPNNQTSNAMYSQGQKVPISPADINPTMGLIKQYDPSIMPNNPIRQPQNKETARIRTKEKY
jgi:hypothetical protein